MFVSTNRKGKSGDNVKSDEFLCEYFVGKFGNTIGFGPIPADVCEGKQRKLRTVIQSRCPIEVA